MREQMTEAGLCCEMLPVATEITRGAFVFAPLEQKKHIRGPVAGTLASKCFGPQTQTSVCGLRVVLVFSSAESLRQKPSGRTDQKVDTKAK